MKENLKKKAAAFLDVAECFVTAVFVICFMFTFLFRTAVVTGHSMENTLFENDRLLVDTLFYTPEKEDIVVINSNVLEETIIKRIVAVSGETVTIDVEKNLVMINSQPVTEDYVREGFLENNGNFSDEFYNKEKGVYEIKVPFGYYFVMGDNRNYSTDSRKIGVVSRDEIVGKVTFGISKGKIVKLG